MTLKDMHDLQLLADTRSVLTDEMWAEKVTPQAINTLINAIKMLSHQAAILGYQQLKDSTQNASCFSQHDELQQIARDLQIMALEGIK